MILPGSSEMNILVGTILQEIVSSVSCMCQDFCSLHTVNMYELYRNRRWKRASFLDFIFQISN
jgi:hypothetical protein